MSVWQRHTLGGIGLAFLIASLFLLFGSSSSIPTFTAGVLFRTGMLLVVLWLALPNVEKLYRSFPTWMWYVSALALVAAAVQRNYLILVLAIFLVLAFFQLASWFLAGMRSDR